MVPRLALPALLLLVLNCSRSTDDTAAPPNVILIMADDLGYETIAANGGLSYLTPEIDRMARQGMRLENAFAQPLCTPTRVQLMTGIYNVRNYRRFGWLDTTQTTFGHLFREAGYRTAVVGKWQLGKDPHSPQQAGFQQHCLWQVRTGRFDSTGRDTRYAQPVLDVDGELVTYGADDYGPRVVVDYALQFMEASRQAGQPFLLYYPMILTHCPFSPTPDSPDWRQDDSLSMTYKGDPRYFSDMVAEMDRLLGVIDRKLGELGIRENTLLVFTGDNGTDAPIVSRWGDGQVAGAKGEVTDAGTRVPLIVQWPAVVPPGAVNRDLIDFTDFLPTLCAAAGIEPPAGIDLDGRSFLPQLRGEAGDPRRWVYGWYSRDGEESEARVFARTLRYKRYADGAFVEIPAPFAAEAPLPVDSLDAAARAVYDSLGGVLERYAPRRLDAI